MNTLRKRLTALEAQGERRDLSHLTDQELHERIEAVTGELVACGIPFPSDFFRWQLGAQRHWLRAERQTIEAELEAFG